MLVPPAKPRPEGHRARALCAVALPTLPPATAPAVVGPTFSQQLFLRVARQVTRFSSWLAQPLWSSVAGAHPVLQLEVASEVSLRPATTVSSRPRTAWRASGAREAGRGPTPRVVWGPGWLCATPAWLAKPTSFRLCCRRLPPDRWATALSPPHHDRPASSVRRESSLGRVLAIYPRHEHEGRQPRRVADASVAGRCGKHDGCDTCVAPGAPGPTPPRSTSAQEHSPLAPRVHNNRYRAAVKWACAEEGGVPNAATSSEQATRHEPRLGRCAPAVTTAGQRSPR